MDTANLDTLRVIVFREDGMYVAQCLEHDISTQAVDIDTLLDRLELTVEAECEMARERAEKPFENIAPAPNYFHGLWEKGSVSLSRLNEVVPVI